LNLCITAPRSALQSENGPKLPVLFYVHGGGFMCGSQSTQISGREIWDGVNLARSALARSDGIIVITINYRVGPLGFLASNELAAYNSSFDEPVGNYGLHDQRTALKWVSEFISGFGGDPENVTAQGGSAGGASCHFLATFPQTNLKRAIISSGTVLLGFMPIDDRQKQFDRFVQKYNADDTQNQKVSKLQAVPVADFVEEIIGTYCPVIDGVWISSKTIGARADLTNPPDLMIGSCTYEVSEINKSR
jgi:carboxylesterase type B